jgi:hypothetical protein
MLLAGLLAGIDGETGIVLVSTNHVCKLSNQEGSVLEAAEAEDMIFE